jgi:hypothetical protein
VIYKRLVLRLSDMILSINPEYSYASSLASTIVESSLHQHFLKDHFQSITDCNDKVSPYHFISHLTLTTLR